MRRKNKKRGKSKWEWSKKIKERDKLLWRRKWRDLLVSHQVLEVSEEGEIVYNSEEEVEILAGQFHSVDFDFNLNHLHANKIFI